MATSPLNPTAMALATGPDLRPPERDDAWGPGVALALVAHGLLVAALAWGVAWRSHQTEPMAAEMWASIPDAEAPPPVVITPLPTPPVMEPPPAPVEPVVPVEPVPDLVIGKKKPPKEPRPERKPREVEVFDSTPVKPRKTDPTQPPPDVNAKQLKEQAARDKAAKDAKATNELEAAKEKAKELAKEKAAQAQAEAQAAAAEAQRQQNLKDIVRRAGGGANPNATGAGARNAGPSEGYSGRLRALFKRNLTWALEDAPGNPETVVSVTVSPSGTITSRTIVSPSGLPAWDEAVLRAIDRTAILPADETGRMQSSMTLHFRMKDY
jgi:colicin import membrane protein